MVMPALFLSEPDAGALALFISSTIKQLENFAGVMNFVIFPMFFASSALYPLWRIREASLPALRDLPHQPFTHAVELICFALYVKFDPVSLRGGPGLHRRLSSRWRFTPIIRRRDCWAGAATGGAA